MLKKIWCFIIVIMIAGCATNQKSWEEVRQINTQSEYRDFINRNSNSSHIEEARAQWSLLTEQQEKNDYDRAIAENTYEAYESFLEKHNSRSYFSQITHRDGKYEDDVRSRMEMVKDDYYERLKARRCADSSLTKTFPKWLKKKDPNEPQRGDLITMGKGIRLAGYHFMSDDPEIRVEVRSGYWIYYDGRGVIKGPDGIRVLVGYDCN